MYLANLQRTGSCDAAQFAGSPPHASGRAVLVGGWGIGMGGWQRGWAGALSSWLMYYSKPSNSQDNMEFLSSGVLRSVFSVPRWQVFYEATETQRHGELF